MSTPGRPDVTFLFTDIEGSTRLWERHADTMRAALTFHDAQTRAAVGENHGTVIKMLGSGVYAAFEDPLEAVNATLQLLLALANPAATHGVSLRVRCGLHAGPVERRDNDFFGSVINRAARIMSAAHGGQVLLSQDVAARLDGRLPPGVTLRDLGSVRLRGLETAEHVYQVVHPQLRADFPPLGSLEATPHNLPHQDAPFFGREHELGEVRQLLSNTRLLTLLGPVGIGKTRLALEVAANALDDYRDGIWLVELSSVSDPAGVETAVAHAFGVVEEAGMPLRQTLAAHVAPRRMLLILDGCEHLIDACARLADSLLRAAPDLRIVATSCEPLRVDGEQTFALPALAHAQPSAEPGGPNVVTSAAPALFAERARLQRPDFALTETNARIIASICARLDGIPLAIELAAAWMATLSLEEIDAHLESRLALTEVDGRPVPPQQRRLRAMLDRSYGRLDEGERILFNRISVFDDGFDLDAAEHVCSAPPLSADDVLDFLTTLADKSLVVIDSDGERSLFRQYKIVRDYARERASDPGSEPGDNVTTRERHAEYLRERGRATDQC